MLREYWLGSEGDWPRLGQRRQVHDLGTQRALPLFRIKNLNILITNLLYPRFPLLVCCALGLVATC